MGKLVVQVKENGPGATMALLQSCGPEAPSVLVVVSPHYRRGTGALWFLMNSEVQLE